MNILLTPRVSEKAMMLAENNVYVFEVLTSANKIEVRKSVEAQFKVKVAQVNIVLHKGKLKVFKRIKGQQTDTKKAIVKLQKGQSIKLFEAAK